RIRSHPARSARSGVTDMAGSSSTPGRKASLTRRARMLSTTSGSRACKVTFRPAAAALWARAVPQAPAPMIPAVSNFIRPPVPPALIPAALRLGALAARFLVHRIGVRARLVQRPSRPGGDVDVAGHALFQPFGPGQGDHGGVVGAID